MEKHFDDCNGDLTSMSDEEEKKQAGKKVLREVKKVKLKYSQEDIGPTESNGCFYHFRMVRSHRLAGVVIGNLYITGKNGLQIE